MRTVEESESQEAEAEGITEAETSVLGDTPLSSKVDGWEWQHASEFKRGR